MTWPKVTEMFGHGNDSSLLCLAAAEMTYNVMTLNLTLPDRKKAMRLGMQQLESLMSIKGTVQSWYVAIQDLRGMLDVDMFDCIFSLSATVLLTSQSRVMERPELRVAMAGAVLAASQLDCSFVAPAARQPTSLGSATKGTTATATQRPRHNGSPWGLAMAGLCVGAASRRAARFQRPKNVNKKHVMTRAVPPEAMEALNDLAKVEHGDFLQQVHDFCEKANLVTGVHGNPTELAATLQQWKDGFSDMLVPPAYAADLPPVELDPNTTYLYGADGAVLVDPMNNKPIPDDWWNGFIGFQADLIKGIDAFLREQGWALSNKKGLVSCD